MALVYGDCSGFLNQSDGQMKNNSIQRNSIKRYRQYSHEICANKVITIRRWPVLPRGRASSCISTWCILPQVVCLQLW